MSLLDLSRALEDGARYDLQDALLDALEALTDAKSAADNKLARLKRPNVDLIQKKRALARAYGIIDGLMDILDQEPALGVTAALRDGVQRRKERQ